MKLNEVGTLTVADLEAHPIWEFPKTGETLVRPAREPIPVADLTFRLVATQVQLANGAKLWGILDNVSPADPLRTEQFVGLTVWSDGRRFDLARYHDVDYAKRGPLALGAFLGLHVDAIFPIRYDIRHLVTGDPAALSGEILKEPRVRLSDEERIKLILG